MSPRPIRVRFAPSPTGYLHVGGARTALYNYLYARKHGGTFVLRVEDTDVERSTEESLRMQLDDLSRLGLHWDEGPHPVTLEDQGAKGPYRQSLRQEIYQQYAEVLLEKGSAYYDFRTDEELDLAKKNNIESGGLHQVPRPDKILSLSEARELLAQGKKGAVRFKVPQAEKYRFKDLVRGDVEFPSEMVSDFVLLRSSGMPVYNFCCAVDDALMEITHVFRAEEHLSNTLRQMMIYEGLGFPLPEFGHLSIILGSDRQKLSKRHGATSVHDFLEGGYLPEALLNFIALLGWSSPSGEEILSMETMVREFDVERLNPASAVFDESKLKWVNATHLRALAPEELEKRVGVFLVKNGLKLPPNPEVRRKSLELFKTSMETLQDSVSLYRFLSDEHFVVSDSASEILGWESTKSLLSRWSFELDALSDEFLSTDHFLGAQERIKNELGVKGKFLFMPLRVAVIGQPHGAELKDLIPLIPRASLKLRVSKVLAAMESV